MTKRFFILSFLLLSASLLFAGNIKFTVSVSNDQVATGDQFQITFSVNGNGDRFSPPDFAGFQILSGPNESSSMTSINGNVSSSLSYSYDLMAVKEGIFTIGPASIVVDGHRLATSPVKIKVVKGRVVRPGNTAPRNDQNVSAPADNSGDLSKTIFIRAAVDKTKLYLGEQLTLSYKLYTRADILGSEAEKLPDLNGFWSQDIKDGRQNVEWRTETYKGLQYNVADIKQTILFPERAGNLVIDPLVMNFTVRIARQPRDLMEQVFGAYHDVKYRAKSAPVTIHVSALPEAGKPAGFSGAVGSFSVDASVDKKELNANDGLNYQLKISGSGNIKLLKAPEINFPADFEKYDPKVTDNITGNASGVSGTRIYNYLLIPRHQGNYTIEPVKFSWFDPSAKRYVTLTTKAFPVKVNKGLSQGNVTAYSPEDREDIKMLGKDIRYIKTGKPDLYRKGEGLYGSFLWYFLLAVGPVLFLGAIAFRKWNEKNNSDLVKVRSRKANKLAAKHLASARQQLQAGDTKAFYEDVAKGMYGYLSNKLNIPFASLNKETITAELQTRALDEALINKLIDTLSLCEMARFAPVSGISMQEVFDKATSMINDIENKI